MATALLAHWEISARRCLYQLGARGLNAIWPCDFISQPRCLFPQSQHWRHQQNRTDKIFHERINHLSIKSELKLIIQSPFLELQLTVQNASLHPIWTTWSRLRRERLWFQLIKRQMYCMFASSSSYTSHISFLSIHKTKQFKKPHYFKTLLTWIWMKQYSSCCMINRFLAHFLIYKSVS